MGKRAKDAHRLTRLDEKRFVVLEIPQSANDLVECFPAAGGAARSAVDDQLPRIFRELFINIRIAASWCQPLQEIDVPRGARMGLYSDILRKPHEVRFVHDRHHLLDIFRQHTICRDVGDSSSNVLIRGINGHARLQRAQVVDTLGGT